MEKGHKVWYVECDETLYVRVTHHSGQGISKVLQGTYYNLVTDCIIYSLYYILAYIQHNGDVSLKKNIYIHTYRV